MALTPSDVSTFCSNFTALDAPGRRQFWSNFLTELANAESDGDTTKTHWLAFDGAMHRPTFRRGLYQISAEAAHNHHYECAVATTADLYTPSANAACAVKILEYNVDASGAIAGAGHYWPSLAHASRGAQLAARISALPPCAVASEEKP